MLVICFFISCSNQNPSISGVHGYDTLYTTLVCNDTIIDNSIKLYREIWPNGLNGFDTAFSTSKPLAIKPVVFGSSGNCGMIINPVAPRFHREVHYDTVNRFVNCATCQDTVVVLDSVFSSVTLPATVTCTLSISPDSIETYLASHRPYIDKKDSLLEVLSRPIEGLRQYIQLPAMHYENDSAEVTLIDNPAWIQLDWIYVYEGYGDCWFYPRCVNGVHVDNICMVWTAKTAATTNADHTCQRPWLVVAADSTAHAALDSTYQWKVVIANRYNQSDTLMVASRVVPFPDPCP